MSFNLVMNHIYALQLWTCTSRHLNLYKVEQTDTYVLHVIFCHMWCPTCIASCVYLFKSWIVKVSVCAL